MRHQFIESLNKFEPFTHLYGLGANPASIKAAVIRILEPYVYDKVKLAEFAVSILAGEAVAVGRLSSTPEFRALLDTCFAIRRAAISKDEDKAFQVSGRFEPLILEAQKNFGLLASFELPKDDLSLEEFAFEILRSLGTLIESAMQPYLKELYCLQAIASGIEVDASAVLAADLGQTCEWLEKALDSTALLTPPPLGIRINQWRNIAHHHSFACEADSIVVSYGRGRSRKDARLSRSELLGAARELVWRLGAMKTSRCLTHFNHIDRLDVYLPPDRPSDYGSVTMLAASFATQGFRLVALELSASDIQAEMEDLAPRVEGLVRPVHCSQFIASFAAHLPGRSVSIRYIQGGRHQWTFSATREALERVMALEDPLKELAHVVNSERTA